MAASASQVRAELNRLTDDGVTRLATVLPLLTGRPETIRADLLDLTPSLILAYSDGSSALAADWYDDLRDEAAVAAAYSAEPVVADRTEKVRRMVAWAAQPLLDGEQMDKVALRLLPDVQKGIARPFRDTITANSKRDTASRGWRRISSGAGCRFCRMLSDRGAVYRQDTARFASHANCHCSAAPVFDGQDGPEATTVQYVASQRRRTEKDRARLREYLDAHY